MAESRNKRPHADVDEEITDPSSEEEENSLIDDNSAEETLDSDLEFEGENPADKRRRLAKQYLDNLKNEARETIQSRPDDAHRVESTPVDDYNNFDAADLDKEIVSARLKEDVAEQQGRVYRFITAKMLLSEAKTSMTRVGEKALTSIACATNAYHDKHKHFAYTVGKDLQLTKYDITDFKRRPKKIKYVQYAHDQHILAVAASPDGKYIVTGGMDSKLKVWSHESLTCIHEISMRPGVWIMQLVFRRDTDQLYVSCSDFKIRTYSISQFSQLETLYGHSDSVGWISALHSEKCVTVGGRDRSAILWKIPEETRLTFQLGKNDPSGSLDVVSMIDDTHFVTGSDNGNISLWSTTKKRPLYTETEAHGKTTDRYPNWITSLYAIPFSNFFVSGSWNGKLIAWQITDNLRGFTKVFEWDDCKGIVTQIQILEVGSSGKELFRIIASISKEHRLGRWIQKIPGARNGIYSVVVEQTRF